MIPILLPNPNSDPVLSSHPPSRLTLHLSPSPSPSSSPFTLPHPAHHPSWSCFAVLLACSCSPASSLVPRVHRCVFGLLACVLLAQQPTIQPFQALHSTSIVCIPVAPRCPYAKVKLHLHASKPRWRKLSRPLFVLLSLDQIHPLPQLTFNPIIVIPCAQSFLQRLGNLE